MHKKSTHTLVFIIRCAGAAAVACELASWFGLPPALVALSALIVSQEHLHETRSSFQGRILGTLLGIGVAVVVGEAATRVPAPVGLQVSLGVAICALVARYFPTMRVAMWTCPIVLVSAHASVPLLVAAFHRGCEVILGAAVGWAFHWAAVRLEGWGLLRARQSTAAAPCEAREAPILE